MFRFCQHYTHQSKYNTRAPANALQSTMEKYRFDLIFLDNSKVSVTRAVDSYGWFDSRATTKVMKWKINFLYTILVTNILTLNTSKETTLISWI